MNNNNEDASPEFVGEYRTSITEGTEEEFFDPDIRVEHQFVSCSISTTHQEYDNCIIAASNTIIIMFFNNIYGLIAEKLNKWKN